MDERHDSRFIFRDGARFLVAFSERMQRRCRMLFQRCRSLSLSVTNTEKKIGIVSSHGWENARETIGPTRREGKK